MRRGRIGKDCKYITEITVRPPNRKKTPSFDTLTSMPVPRGRFDELTSYTLKFICAPLAILQQRPIS